MSNQFERSVSDSGDVDWSSQARPGPILGICAFIIAVAGLTGSLVFPQLWMFGAHLRGIFEHVVPVLISMCGLVAIPLGARVASGRLWAAILTVPAMSLLTVLGLTWTIYSMVRGGFTPLYLVLLMASGMGVVCSVIAVGLSMTVHQARRALLAD